MGSTKKYAVIGLFAILLILLVVGLLALSEPSVKDLSRDALLNQSNQTDLIVSVNERYINSILQSELKERQPKGIKNITVYLSEGGTVEVVTELEIFLGITKVYPQIKVEANLSAENNTLRVRPELISVGKLNLPQSIWIGPVNTAISAVEDAANQAAASVLQKGFQITGIHIGDHYLTLAINAPPPKDLKKVLHG